MIDHKTALMKKTFRKQDRKKWERVMHNEMMSSKDSLEVNDEEVLKI